VTFPYIPGLLSFREIPAIIPVLHALSVVPDLVIADGQGIAHARGLGLASHLGVLTGIPTIGCAKSKLIGSYEEPGPRKGDWEYLYLGDEVIGAVVRSRDNVKPLFVSIGHGITLHSAVYYILKCCITYRITEPIRYAHRLAGGIV
jgi:deoxyribonuclease V